MTIIIRKTLFYVSLVLCIVFVFAGCATRRVSTTKQIVLSDMPVYKGSKTNWDTSANCMIYPMFNANKKQVDNLSPKVQRANSQVKKALLQHGVLDQYEVLGQSGVNLINASLKNLLQQQGYGIVEMDTYMPSSKRNKVNKIIIPMTYSTRSCVLNGTNIWDIMAIYSVQEGPKIPFDSEKIPPRQYFQIWARGDGELPYSKIAENLMQVDTFRLSLQEEIK